jgi:hypothetical protein
MKFKDRQRFLLTRTELANTLARHLSTRDRFSVFDAELSVNLLPNGDAEVRIEGKIIPYESR